MGPRWYVCPCVGLGIHAHETFQLDFNPILSRTSLELVGRAGIGYSFDPMVPGQERTDLYAKALRELLSVLAACDAFLQLTHLKFRVTVFKLGLLLPFLPFILKIFPFRSFLRFMINVIPLPALHQLRDLVDFTDATATKLVVDRTAAIKSGESDLNDDAKDLMSILSTASGLLCLIQPRIDYLQ
jgi:hypothetical protein